mgnify:CR=1 FL=1
MADPPGHAGFDVPGHRLVMIDDDAVCEVYDPPQVKPGITFSDAPREAEFFASEQEWSHWRQPINPDPVNRHMQCLGLTFAEALNVLGQNHLKPSSFQNATALELSELQTGSEVLITESGSLGCPGTRNNTWLPDMAPASLQRMLASAEKTAQALLELTGGNLNLVATLLLWFSALASGIVDNIPYTATMIPLIKSMGQALPIEPLWWSLALGACLVERHITLDRAMWGSDQSASVAPWGVEQLVKYIRVTERSLGDGIKRVYGSEESSKSKLRKYSE